MPPGSIIDTHLHLWDPLGIRYPWLDNNVVLNRAYLVDDYRKATDGIPVESMVFVQCEAEFSAFEAEVAWAAEIAKTEPRIKGIVAWAPLEKGEAVAADLERLRQSTLIRGIRRIIQFEPDLDFCLRPDFIAGVRTLADFDLSFDICIDHRHMANILNFVERIPEVPMILDHIGKPDIKTGIFHPWSEQIRQLARFPHIRCKISGVATEADHERWTAEDLKGYVDVAIDAFGFERVMFGGDWPVCTEAITYRAWIDILDGMLTGVDESSQRKFWRENAAAFYRL